MEQPEIFTPAAYHELLASLQPVYGLTAGLTNKMVSKAVARNCWNDAHRRTLSAGENPCPV